MKKNTLLWTLARQSRKSIWWGWEKSASLHRVKKISKTGHKVGLELTDWRVSKWQSLPELIAIWMPAVARSKFAWRQHVDIDFSNMIDIIQLYAKCNDAFHLELLKIFEAKDFHRIAKWLYRDIENLTNVIRHLQRLQDDRSSQSLWKILLRIRKLQLRRS